jgi:ribosomal protein S18 acetylase RimI-like enzyme
MYYKALKDERYNTLYTAFTKAFSDYQVNINLSPEAFQRMLKRRGYSPEFSYGAYDNDELIGFILNGIRKWNNKITAYDTGTGVIATYRKRGVTTKLFSHIKEILLQNQVEQYLLEVIQSNNVAADLYLKQGFQITREFICYQAEKIEINKVKSCEAIISSGQFDIVNWDQLESFWDFMPSWQNSVDSVICAKDSLHMTIARLENNVVGYGIIDMNTGDIPQLAVKRKFRNMGIGHVILKNLVGCTKSNHIRFINVEDSCETLNKFLRNNGLKEITKQYEMVMSI